MLSVDLQDFRGVYANRHEYFETTKYLQVVTFNGLHTLECIKQTEYRTKK